jgi:hypothetical protein
LSEEKKLSLADAAASGPTKAEPVGADPANILICRVQL